MLISHLIDLIKNPIKSFNFFWITADTDDDIHYYNINLFESLKVDSDLFCFYIDYSSKSRASIINMYIDIINKLLTQNRTLSPENFILLKQQLTDICNSTNSFKLYGNDSLQKIQISYNVIYEDKKYEHHNFNHHLSIIFNCISKFHSICFIIENGHLLERHVVMLLSSFLLSKSSLTIVFTFPNVKLSMYSSLNNFFSLIKLNNYLTKHITLAPPIYQDVLTKLKSQSSLSHQKIQSLSSLIIKKSSRSIFLIDYFINNISLLDSDFIQSQTLLTPTTFITHILDQLSESTKQCILLACLENSPFNLHDICRYYKADYATLKLEALETQLIVPEVSFSSIEVIRDDYFQFSTISIPSTIINLLSQDTLSQLHEDHISYSIKSKKTISSCSVSYIMSSSHTYQFLTEPSNDFFSQLMLEAYSSAHLEHYSAAYEFFLLIMHYLKKHFIHSQALHFDIAYHLLLCKRDCNHSDLKKDWDYCFSIALNNTQRSLLSLFTMTSLHKQEFSFDDIILEASVALNYLSIHMGFIPKHKFFISIKLATECLKLYYFKLKKRLFLSTTPVYSSKDLLILGQLLDILLLSAPSYLVDFISLMQARILEESSTQKISSNFIKLVSILKQGNIAKLESQFKFSSLSSFNHDITYTDTLTHLLFSLFIFPLKFGLLKSRQNLSKSLSSTPPTDYHYWLAFINFQLYFQYFYGIPIKSIKQSYELNVFFFVNNSHISESSTISQNIDFHKSILDLFIQNKPFDLNNFLLTYKDLFKKTHDIAENILKLVTIFLCFFKHDFKSSISLCREIENNLTDYFYGIFYPLFCFYYSLSLFFDYHYSTIKSKNSLELLNKHIDVFNYMLNQKFKHFKSYKLILDSIKCYYHNNHAGHRFILEAVDVATKNKQPLLSLIAHEIAAIFYQKINDNDNVKKYINTCITKYNHLNYYYKSNCLSKYYYPYLRHDISSSSLNIPENIIFMLKNKHNIQHITDIELSYMFEFIFRFIDFDCGYFFISQNNHLIPTYRFSSKQDSLSKVSHTIDTLPPFITMQCNHIAYKKETMYIPSIQSLSSFSNDPYLFNNQIFSIIGIPLLTPHQTIFGILYFEKKDSKQDLSSSQLETLHNYIHLFELIIHNQSLIKNNQSDLLSFDTRFQKSKPSQSIPDPSKEPNVDPSKLGIMSDILSNNTQDSLDYYIALKKHLYSMSTSLSKNHAFKLNKPSLTNISSLLNYGITIIQPECRKRSISIHTDFSNMPDILVDFRNILLIFFNIIIQRMDAMSPHSLISISTSHIVENNYSFIAISFIDSSSNTVDDNFLNIFLNNNTDNTLLDFSIVLLVMDEHKGLIELSSQPDCLTCITLKLPYLNHDDAPIMSDELASITSKEL